ncbi:MAG: hypothetical protein H6618_08235 [Deltaproteobacteria bacterium]|nr:hypothetical protein [Deltaproteobacteria bacterium]
MKRLNRPWRYSWIFFAIMLPSACKTNSNRSNYQSETEGVSSGVFDSTGKMRLAVPADLKDFTPPANISTKSQSNVAKVQGLSLTEGKPTSSAGIEEIITKCFTHDSQFIAEGWYFYAELISAGQTIKSYSSQEVNRCNEMQLELQLLEKNTRYKVVASFFWQSSDRKKTIVWYEGSTKEFTPSDRNIPLVMEKLLYTQKVDVDVEKSEKELCNYRKYLWNGQRCLDGYNAISFGQSDLTDYAKPAEEAGSRVRKCLQMGDGGFAVQWDCHYKSPQMVRTKLHGAQKLNNELPPEEYGWFTIQFNAGKLCLQVQPVNNGDPYLIQQECDEEVPRSDQLFTLVETTENDSGGRNSFRIMNQADGTARCLSIPPEEGDLTGVAPLRNGAPVRLTPCRTTNPNIRSSQFTRFVSQDD